MSEGAFIDNYLKPLSMGFNDALNLNDDAAILKNFKDKNFVVSVDNFITGVHCPNWLNASYSITRAILIAVSDISAMGAKPYCIFLSISMPKKIKKNLFDDLQKGIKKALLLTDMKLAGGDLCTYDGPLSFCVTVLGRAKKNNILKRAGARFEDFLCLTGTIGDAKIGLDSLLKKRKLNKSILTESTVSKFLCPTVRTNFSQKIAKYANACIDISDGLFVDVSKLAKYSNCGLKVFSKNIPLSVIAKEKLKIKEYFLKDFISAGDDYELAFAIKKKNLEVVKKIAYKMNVKFTVIGEFTKENVILLDKNTFTKGYAHF
jgi:thiamine-monophosphate kinase